VRIPVMSSAPAMPKKNIKDLLALDAPVLGRFWLTWITICVITAIVSLRSPIGPLSLDSKELLSIAVPVAGTLVALTLPAAQIAQSVINDWLSAGEKLIAAVGLDDSLRKYLNNRAESRRRDLQLMLGSMYFSIASLVSGLVAEVAPSKATAFACMSVSSKDVFSVLALVALLATLWWLVPVLRSSFDFKEIDAVMAVINKTPTPLPPSPAPAATPAPNAPTP
jgi:hypothetical protein